MKTTALFVLFVVASVSSSPSSSGHSSHHSSGSYHAGSGHSQYEDNPHYHGHDRPHHTYRLSKRSANPAGLLGGLLGGGAGEGTRDGLLGINLSDSVGGIIGSGGDPNKASKNAVFFKDLYELLNNVLHEPISETMSRNRFLARSIVNKVRGAGFCDLTAGKGYSLEFQSLINQ